MPKLKASEVPDPTLQTARDKRSTANFLVELGLVDAPSDQAFDKFTKLVTRILKVPVALVSFVEEERDRQFFKSQIGLTGTWAEQRCTPLSHSFCQFVKRDNRPLIIEDAPSDSRVCGNLAIPDFGVKAYLGVPIHGPRDAALGALCAIDTVPRNWTLEEVDTMVHLAACVTDLIKLRNALLRILT